MISIELIGSTDFHAMLPTHPPRLQSVERSSPHRTSRVIHTGRDSRDRDSRDQHIERLQPTLEVVAVPYTIHCK